MRPIWAEFPEDEAGFDEEREWLVGPGLLVRPVVEPDVDQVSLYLPGKAQTWLECLKIFVFKPIVLNKV